MNHIYMRMRLSGGIVVLNRALAASAPRTTA